MGFNKLNYCHRQIGSRRVYHHARKEPHGYSVIAHHRDELVCTPRNQPVFRADLSRRRNHTMQQIQKILTAVLVVHCSNQRTRRPNKRIESSRVHLATGTQVLRRQGRLYLRLLDGECKPRFTCTFELPRELFMAVLPHRNFAVGAVSSRDLFFMQGRELAHFSQKLGRLFADLRGSVHLSFDSRAQLGDLSLHFASVFRCLGTFCGMAVRHN